MNSINNMFIENFKIELQNTERALIQDSKNYFFAYDTKIQNFPFSLYFKKISNIFEDYMQINNLLNLQENTQLLEIYQTKMFILITLANELNHNVNIYEKYPEEKEQYEK